MKSLKDELIQSVLCSESLNKVAEKAAKYLNNPIVVINNAYKIIAYSKSIKVNDLTWNNAVERGYITLEFGATLNNWNDIKDKDTKYECLTVNKINKLRRRFYKLEINSELMGYLNVTEVNKDFDDIEPECYYFVSQILAKEIFINQRIIRPRRHCLNEDILLELVHNIYVNRLHFMERVQLSNLNVKSKYRVVCSNLTNFLSYNADEDHFKLELLSFFPSGTIIINEKILIILIDIDHPLYKNFSFSKNLDRYLKNKKLILGISDIFADLYKFKLYENQAIKSYENKKYILEDSLNYVFYEEVKSYDLLHQIPKKNLLYFCNQKILKIYKYDKNHNTNYLETLMVYLKTNKSIKMTSNYMYVHRNTINYRILKIRELFEIDLDDNILINEFLLSCQIIQILD
ncbi:PucR family transcriptional regulator [Haloimpatiens sp. FM7315]|uniref:PucR family transcriptional regulator n=1 Tax=Haloimpatiens sp. FM7315 TaxID=3298609 RepID=UPI00370BDD34